MCPLSQIARLLSRTEERLVETERDLIGAVRRSIEVTEGMIRLVRSTTTTTQALMAPLREPLREQGGERRAERCRLSRCSITCVCERVAMAKDLVRVRDWG